MLGKSVSGFAGCVILSLLLLFASVPAQAQETFVFADFSWDSAQVHNRIAGFIVEHGFGYDVDYTFGDTIPILLGMRRGDVDIAMEMWIDNILDAYEEAIESGELVDLGSNFPDSPQGWYVPTYVIEGDEERGIEALAPDLQSVKDLPQYWEVFADPEVRGKGRFYNAPPGWVVHDINLSKFSAYGLDEYYNVFNPGSDTALATAILGAYQRGEPVLAYYWEPTWVMGLLDMTILEEPPFDEEIWDDNFACAFPPSRVHVAVNADVLAKAPELITFLANYNTTLDQTNEIMAYLHEEEASIEEAALYFLDTYREEWKRWIFLPEIQAKVEAALDEELSQ